jgi:membrane-bound serine protease (ClpP class)
MWLIFAVFLFAACAIILVLEIFVPSFGLLSLVAIGALAGGVAIFFNSSTAVGWLGVGIAVVVIPIVWVVTYRMFPNTRFGKSVILGKVERDKGDAVPDTNELKSLMGEVGFVLSPLRPVGMCDFEGHRVECVAETGYIEKDSKVQVINVEATQLTVRLTEAESE